MPVTCMCVGAAFFGLLLLVPAVPISLILRQAGRFYIAAVFDKSFGRSEAVVCYDEKTQTAYFHWVGVD